MTLEQLLDTWSCNQIPPKCSRATTFSSWRYKHTNKSKGHFWGLYQEV